MDRAEAIAMIESMGKYLSEGNPIWEVEPVKEATDMAIEALSAEAHLTCKTCADRAVCIMSAPDGNWRACKDYRPPSKAEDRLYIKIYADDDPSVKAEKLYQICGETQNREVAEWLKEYFPSVDKPTGWIPCSERLPEKIEPVNITWTNRKPEPYYDHIKDKPFVATGIYGMGKWHWYSSVCEDYLAETGQCKIDEINRDIEILAWMPLPEPYRKEQNHE